MKNWQCTPAYPYKRYLIFCAQSK